MTKNTKIVTGVAVLLFVCISVIGFFLIMGSGMFLARSTTQPSTQYFLTVSEVMGQKEKMFGKQVRISGAVVGDTIQFDEANKQLVFLIADVPGDYADVEKQGGLAAVLKNAVNDPDSQRIQIVYSGEKPELLRNMAQAIMTGELRSDSLFYADEILLKCPSRYEKAVPDQAID